MLLLPHRSLPFVNHKDKLSPCIVMVNYENITNIRAKVIKKLQKLDKGQEKSKNPGPREQKGGQ